jgi:hypothetical protein
MFWTGEKNKGAPNTKTSPHLKRSKEVGKEKGKEESVVGTTGSHQTAR